MLKFKTTHDSLPVEKVCFSRKCVIRSSFISISQLTILRFVTLLCKDFKCANCLKNHQVGSNACPALAKAVAKYLAYISSE